MPHRGYFLIKKRAVNTHLARTEAVWTDTTDRKFDAYRLSVWMEDIAKTLRLRLGEPASKVPTRRMPNSVFKFLSLFIPQLRMFTSELGRRNDLTSEKARRELGFAPRPATETVIDCALSLLERGPMRMESIRREASAELGIARVNGPQ